MRALLIYDTSGWAWYYKAINIQRCLKDEFERIDTCAEKDASWEKLAKYHAIHFFGWMQGPKRAAISTCGISSHNFEAKHHKKAKKMLPRYRAVTAVNRIIYKKLYGYANIIHLAENGVDETLFTPKKNDGKFTVGWMGQPTVPPFDQHGFTKIWQPVKEKLEKAGINVLEHIATHKTAIPQDQMPKEFYHKIDVLVHTGLMTGTPNPMFEAAACGKPSVSSRIGCAPEFIDDGRNGFLIVQGGPRAVDDFVHTIKFLSRNRDRCEEIGAKARQVVEEDWTWKQKAREWIPVLRNHARKL